MSKFPGQEDDRRERPTHSRFCFDPERKAHQKTCAISDQPNDSRSDGSLREQSQEDDIPAGET
ncbi:hypothetical protein RLEG3_27820 [Rhizobium leguminosarum bv. trifolii WSM1689]|nr:hypothetical protein RLEG3_27820 [Rhizobium leguminosarum bv. trifolii WSM1689]